ncbi:hypothetical protein RUM43_008468 [Polyplax serrata]|uniref:Uncharacterized protein n=1 Tax=Polyplax serrata TaxID=468196 RepID=A0AAN8NYL0_POLSC
MNQWCGDPPLRRGTMGHLCGAQITKKEVVNKKTEEGGIPGVSRSYFTLWTFIVIPQAKSDTVLMNASKVTYTRERKE